MKNKELRAGPLTAQYAALHGVYWFAYCGLFSFAAVFLLGKGYSASQTGVLLALATLSSCLLQPSVAAAADRERRISLKGMMALLFISIWVCLAALLFLKLSPLVYAAIYLVGALLLDLTMPLVNALCVYYNNRGVRVNFGVGRGVGSLFFAAASALFGFVADRLGVNALLYIVFACVLAGLVVIVLFPRVSQRPADASAAMDAPTDTGVPCTLPQFFKRYKLYCISLVGVLFMATFHSMTENYLIAIMKSVGGSSSNLGIALAIATVLEIPVIVFYSRFCTRMSSGRWLCLAGVGFLLKSVLFLAARSVAAIYWIEVLQIVSYSLYAPTSVYYARESVDACDMVKGQAMITSFYALGASLGNFLGGRLLDVSGVTALLRTAVAFAASSVLILVLTTRKQERSSQV